MSVCYEVNVIICDIDLHAHRISTRSQSAAQLLLLSVSENGRPPYRLTFGFNFDLFIVMGMMFYIEIGQRTVEL